jgi:hypothetical protein
MVEMVTHRPLIPEARVQAEVNPCGICGGQCGTGTGYSQSSLVFPCRYHCSVALNTRISSKGWKISPLVVAVQRDSLIPVT